MTELEKFVHKMVEEHFEHHSVRQQDIEELAVNIVKKWEKRKAPNPRDTLQR